MEEQSAGSKRSDEIVGASLELMAKADEVGPGDMLISYMRAAHTIAAAIRADIDDVSKLKDIKVSIKGVTIKVEWND